MEHSSDRGTHAAKDSVDQKSATSLSQFTYGRTTIGAKDVKDVNLNVTTCCAHEPAAFSMNGERAIGSDTTECAGLANHLKIERNHSIKRSVQFHEEPTEVVPNDVTPHEDLVADEDSSPVKNMALSAVKHRGSLTSTPSQCETHFSDDVDDDDGMEDESSLEEQYSEPQPPDGGWGWVVVVAAFVTNLIADGVTFTFGIIYVDLLRYFGEAKSKTAWIGGLFMSMPLISGPIASYLADRFGCRRICMFGSVLSAFGFVVSSYAESIELLIFTFGIISGFGLALCYVTAVVIVAYYFEKRRSLATGLSVCGSGIGTFLFAPLTTFLVTEYGWRGTTLILAGLFLNMAVCGALMRDLKWTKEKSKALRKDRMQKYRDKRKNKAQSVCSVGSFSQNERPRGFTGTKELKQLLQRGDIPGEEKNAVTTVKPGFFFFFFFFFLLVC
jgi:MFS family permease